MNSNFTRAEIKAQAKEQLRGKVWMFFLVNVIVYAILIPISFLTEMEASFKHKFASKPEVIDGNMAALKMAMQEVQ